MTNKMIKKQAVFFIFLLYYTYSGRASIRETDDKKKHLHLVKYEQKIFKIKYIGVIYYNEHAIMVSFI